MSYDTQIVVGDSIKATPTTDGKTIKLELRWMTVDEEHPEKFPMSWGIVLEFPFDATPSYEPGGELVSQRITDFTHISADRLLSVVEGALGDVATAAERFIDVVKLCATEIKERT